MQGEHLLLAWCHALFITFGWISVVKWPHLLISFQSLHSTYPQTSSLISLSRPRTDLNPSPTKNTLEHQEQVEEASTSHLRASAEPFSFNSLNLTLCKQLNSFHSLVVFLDSFLKRIFVWFYRAPSRRTWIYKFMCSSGDLLSYSSSSSRVSSLILLFLIFP